MVEGALGLEMQEQGWRWGAAPEGDGPVKISWMTIPREYRSLRSSAGRPRACSGSCTPGFPAGIARPSRGPLGGGRLGDPESITFTGPVASTIS